jgi:hypothetical protein
MPILGHLVLYKSGHLFNHEFLKVFFNKKSAWETRSLMEYESENRHPGEIPPSAAINDRGKRSFMESGNL